MTLKYFRGILGAPVKYRQVYGAPEIVKNNKYKVFFRAEGAKFLYMTFHSVSRLRNPNIEVCVREALEPS